MGSPSAGPAWWEATPGPDEREFPLILDTGDARHPASRGVLDQVVQQRHLAQAWLPADYKGPALTGPNRFEEPLQHVGFPAGARSSPAGPRRPEGGRLPGTDTMAPR